MKTIFVIPNMARGGAEVFLKDLATYFADKGYSPCIVSGGGELLDHIDKTVTTCTLPTLSKNIFTAIRWIFSIKKIVRNNVVNTICSNSILTAIIVYFATFERQDIKKILMLHNPLKSWYFYILRYFSSFGLEMIVSVGEINRRKLLQSGVKKEKIVHIPNAVNTQKFTYSGEHSIKKNPVIGVIARIEKYKGHSYLVDAIKKIELENGVSFEVFFCGEGSYKERLKKYISGQSLQSNIVFKGKCTDIPSILSSIDIFVLPSYVEAFPISIIEAMSSGVPVIATKVGDIPNIITDDETGLLVEPKNADAIADALLKIMRNKDLYQSVKKNARNIVENSFSSEVVFEKYIRVCGRIGKVDTIVE